MLLDVAIAGCWSLLLHLLPSAIAVTPILFVGLFKYPFEKQKKVRANKNLGAAHLFSTDDLPLKDLIGSIFVRYVIEWT